MASRSMAVLMPVILSKLVASVLLGRRREILPGAGMDPGSIQPFKTVLKDGFSPVACINDHMYTHGDKFGRNKAQYSLDAHVSIVHYSAHVPKMEQQPMSHEVCYSFCRTVDGMGFFGIVNGRDCYCTPYFRAEAGDDSMCDAVCEGQSATVCGGKSKSSVFSMHQCLVTGRDLANSQTAMQGVQGNLEALFGEVDAASIAMQSDAQTYQAKFGAAADPVAASLMQRAKVEAGRLEKVAARANTMSNDMKTLNQKVGAFLAGAPDFSTPAILTQAETFKLRMGQVVENGEQIASDLQQNLKRAAPHSAANASAAYYSVMYFVDKDFVGAPSTCGGSAAGAPLVGDLDACAGACNAAVHSCVGFSFFPSAGHSEGLCFLMSKLESTTYYAGCSQSAPGVKCYAKFSKFNGATLKPDPSGACGLCLKNAKRADRCFS